MCRRNRELDKREGKNRFLREREGERFDKQSIYRKLFDVLLPFTRIEEYADTTIYSIPFDSIRFDSIALLFFNVSEFLL